MGTTAAGAQAGSDPAQLQADRQTTQTAPQKLTPQGYLDPDFGLTADKPHAGTPQQADGATPPIAAQSPPDATGTPQWYKESPQPYDHPAPRPRHLRAPKTQVKVYDDTAPAPQEMAQEAPPRDETPAPQYDAPPAAQPHVQPVPRYYPQQDQGNPPQPQQNYGSQDYGSQGNGSQENGQQDYLPPQDYAQPGDDDYGTSAPAPTQPPLSAQQLEQLVAPIALYPDQLVAQILTASTYPAQITAADQWLRQMNGASPEQIAAAASAQTAWDPSVKALTAFPQVLAMLDSNLQWTAALGNAYYNQPQDVLETVQALRQRAQQAGNLQSTPQEQVIQDPGYIQIQPATPEYIYVPSYNPWYVYGTPLAPYPGFAFGNWGLYIGGGVEYGLGFPVSAFVGVPFGVAAWGLDWVGCSVLFHHDGYWTHSRQVRDWGFEHGGRRWDGGGRGWYGRGGYGGRDMARFGDRFGNGYHHEPIQAHPGGGYGRTPLGRGFGGPRQSFDGRDERGFGHIQGGGPTRPEAPRQQAYGRMPEAFGGPQRFEGRQEPYRGGPQTFGGRPQAYGGGSQNLGVRPQPYQAPFRSPSEPYRQFGGQPPRLGNGQGQYPRPGQGFGGRPQPFESDRAPQQNLGHPGFGGGQSFARPQPHEGGGFHPFSGGHTAPSFGGGHAYSGGGHSFSGGGHSFGGGGHSSGGGHSGGGHHR